MAQTKKFEITAGPNVWNLLLAGLAEGKPLNFTIVMGLCEPIKVTLRMKTVGRTDYTNRPIETGWDISGTCYSSADNRSLENRPFTGYYNSDERTGYIKFIG